MKDKTAAYKPWRMVRHEITEWRRLPSGTLGKEFTLSGYGLPEPKSVPKEEEIGPTGVDDINYRAIGLPPIKPASNTWLWVVLAVVILIAGAAYIRYRRSAD